MLLLPLATAARQASFSGRLKGKVPAGMRIYVMPVGATQARPDTVAYAGGHYSAVCGQSAYGFYNIVAVYHQRQSITPFVVAGDRQKLGLAVDTLGVKILKPDSDNKALAAFNEGYVSKSKEFWMNGRSMDKETLRQNVEMFPELADSLIKAMRPGARTAEYLRLWAATLYFETLGNLKFATGRSASDLGLSVHDEAVRLLNALDTPMASLFDAATDVAIASCQGKSLGETLGGLTTLVSDPALRDKAKGKVVRRWLNRFDYMNHYDDGLEELEELTQKYGLDGKYLAEYQTRKAAVKAAPFPESAKLYDTDGNAVSFARFRGKWVYVDLWASWCVPCIKEVPHLKRLEAELEGLNVAFVSISIDSNRDAWKKKMAQLDLHGYQLINDDESLGKALNVNAIPRFLIYDPEGRLNNDNAPRPSDTRTKPLLEKLCQPSHGF